MEKKDINTETWTDNVLNSLQGIKKVEPNPFLYRKIVDKLHRDEYQISGTIKHRYWQTLIALSLWSVINIAGVLFYLPENETEPGIEKVVQGYDLVDDDIYFSLNE